MYKNIKLQVRAIVHTKEGRLLKRYPWKTANSLIKQFIQILMAQMAQANQIVKDIAGVDKNVCKDSNNLAFVAGVDITNNGILIGSGTTAVSMTNNKIETQTITNVAHAAQSIALENPNVSTWRINISRIFTNNTGGVLSIKEVGLYCYGGAYPQTFCIERTLYAVDVPDTYPIAFQYRITITL